MLCEGGLFFVCFHLTRAEMARCYFLVCCSPHLRVLRCLSAYKAAALLSVRYEGAAWSDDGGRRRRYPSQHHRMQWSTTTWGVVQWRATIHRADAPRLLMNRVMPGLKRLHKKVNIPKPFPNKHGIVSDKRAVLSGESKKSSHINTNVIH